jgi:hypothetical protein
MQMSIADLTNLGPDATIVNVGKHAGRRELRGAVRYRPGDLLLAEHLTLPIAHDKPVLLYAVDGPDETVEQIAEKFRASGYADVRVLGATLADVENAGGELQEPTNEQVVPPHRPEEVSSLDHHL